MFKTCPNFRDVGGYPASGGRTVRRGRIYRSGTLAQLGASDHGLLRTFGIRTICDLRRDAERDHEPTSWPDGTVRIVTFPYRSEFGAVIRDLHRPEATPEDAADAIERFYGQLPINLAPALRGVFEEIAQGRTPLLFHCAAGKDRTGVVAGFLLDILGVPREIVLDDYARSAELSDYETMLSRHPETGLGLSQDGLSLSTLPKPIRARLLASDPRYLSAMFAKIEAEAGSAEAYLATVIGLDGATIAAVRAELLD